MLELQTIKLQTNRKKDFFPSVLFFDVFAWSRKRMATNYTVQIHFGWHIYFLLLYAPRIKDTKNFRFRFQRFCWFFVDFFILFSLSPLEPWLLPGPLHRFPSRTYTAYLLAEQQVTEVGRGCLSSSTIFFQFSHDSSGNPPKSFSCFSITVMHETMGRNQ